MNPSNYLKNILIRSIFAKVIRNIKITIELARIPHLKSEIEQKTAYCISPYKTGTTYLASCFSQEVSEHEPLHHLSLKLLERDFDGFFARRMKYLNLKLECSGFFSVYVNELAKNELAKDLDYICILRPPSSWLASVINHWHSTLIQYKNYAFINELFWKKKVGVDLFEFQIGLDNHKNQKIIDKLIYFYFDFIKKTTLLKNVTYIRLKEIDEKLSSIESLIDETADNKNRWKRETKSRRFTYENKSVDAKYERLISQIIKDKNISTYN